MSDISRPEKYRTAAAIALGAVGVIAVGSTYFAGSLFAQSDSLPERKIDSVSSTVLVENVGSGPMTEVALNQGSTPGVFTYSCEDVTLQAGETTYCTSISTVSEAEQAEAEGVYLTNLAFRAGDENGRWCHSSGSFCTETVTSLNTSQTDFDRGQYWMKVGVVTLALTSGVAFLGLSSYLLRTSGLRSVRERA